MKKFISLLLVACMYCMYVSAQNVGINASGTAPDNSAMLDVQSSSKGMLVPRMTTAQRTAIASPATGLLVFDNTTGSFWFKSTAGWVELIDNSNNTWTKKDTSVYLDHSENVGIGTSAPALRLEIDRGTDAKKTGGGYLQLGASANQNLAFDNNEIQSRDNGHFSDISLQADGGNVGIGTKLPETRLQISNGTDVSTVGGYLQLGAGSLQNLGFDNNEIQSRNDGKPSTLFLQNSGGNINVGSTLIGTPAANIEMVNGNVNFLNGKLTKTNTGNYNMMPLCYGRVLADGTLKSGTPNVTIVKDKNYAGQYYIYCPEITSSTILTATSNGSPTMIHSYYIKDGEAWVGEEYYDGTPGNGIFSLFFITHNYWQSC